MSEIKLTLRQTEILKLVNTRGYLTIEELAEHFKKTTQTIRSDVSLLADSGNIKRFHGGVTPVSNREQVPYGNRRITNHAAKQKIASLAADLIHDGSSIYLGIGTTVEEVAHCLKSKNSLRVVTNNINAISILAEAPNIQILIAGGEVRKNDLAVIGETAIEFLNNFRVEFAIAGISGLDENGDLLDFDFRESNILRSVIRSAKKTILVSDSSKFFINPITRVANISEIDFFVSEKKPPEEFCTIMEENNVRLITP